MTGFDDRKKTAENKFQLDEEMRFKINARRTKLLGLWVAQQLGHSGDAAETYAKSLVVEDMSKPGDDDVVQKVLADTKAKGLDISEHRIRKELEGATDAEKTNIEADIAADNKEVRKAQKAAMVAADPDITDESADKVQIGRAHV